MANHATIRRIYYPYNLWEDYRHGLYSGDAMRTNEAEPMIAAAASLLGSPARLRAMMYRVTREWPVAAAVNLTHMGRNRRAWLGQAACCLSDSVPEEQTKLAWHRLGEGEQDAANAVADVVIRDWELGWRMKGGLFA